MLALLRTALRLWPDNGDGIYLRLPIVRSGPYPRSGETGMMLPESVRCCYAENKKDDSSGNHQPLDERHTGPHRSGRAAVNHRV